MKIGIYPLAFIISFVGDLRAQQALKFMVPRMHGAQIKLAEFSPDARMVVTLAVDNSAKLWHAQTGLLLADLEGTGETNVVNMFSSSRVCFSNDKRRLIISGKFGKEIRLWNAQSGKFIIEIKEVSDEFVEDFGFSEDNKYITVTTAFKGIMLFNAENGEFIKTIESPDFGASILRIPGLDRFLVWKGGSEYYYLNYDGSRSESIAVKSEFPLEDIVNQPTFSRDGNYMVFQNRSMDMIICLNLKNGEAKAKKNEGRSYKKIIFGSAEISKDIRFLAIVNNEIEVYDIDLTKLKQFTLNNSDVTHASISYDGSKLLAFNESYVSCWNLITGENLFNMNEQNGWLPTKSFYSSAFFCPPLKGDSSGSSSVLISNWHSAALFEIKTQKSKAQYKGVAGEMTGLRVSIDGKFAVRLTNDPMIGMRIMDLNNAQDIPMFIENNEVVYYACFGNTPIKKYMLTVSTDNVLRVWNYNSKTLVAKMTDLEGYMVTAEFDKNDSKVLCLSTKGVIKILSIDSNSIIGIEPKTSVLPKAKYGGFTSGLAMALFNKGGNKVLAVDRLSGILSIWNSSTGERIDEIKSKDTIIQAMFFQNQGRDGIVALSNRGVLKTLGESGIILKSVKLPEGGIRSLLFGHNDRILVLDAMASAAYLYDIFSLRLIATIKNNEVPVSSAIFSGGGEYFALGYHNGQLFKYKSSSGERVQSFIGHESKVLGVQFINKINDDQYIISLSEDRSCRLWSSDKTAELLSWYSIQGGDYLLKKPDGFYSGSKNAPVSLHYTTSNLEVITFEQLDVKYNRPDKVLEAIGNTDTALINSYRKAYEKRIKKLGVDTTSFQEGYSVPEADFINRNNIEYEQKSNVLAIHIKGEDSAYKLDRFNIWVNEIPLYGQKGISLRKQNRNSIDTTLTIQLSNGENRIETSILNVNGTESYRIPLSVKYLPEKASAPKVHFIGLAVEKFNNPGYNLDYSVKDIRDMARRFKQRYGDTLEIDTLMNEGVTYTSVAALKQKLLKTKVNDKVILAYSGHGLLSKEYDYYLGTSNVDFEHPEINGLPYDALENLLDSIPARQKLMLIDACHSGEVDKEEGIHIAQFADSLGLRRGAEVSNSTDTAAPHLGLNNSFELMQNLFVNVGKGTGATIISASAGNQFALERGDLENGVFTFSILEAMNNNPTMLVSQLKSTVGKRVVELTGGMQKPTSRNEIINSDWRLW
jgi:WD40 repeat protein